MNSKNQFDLLIFCSFLFIGVSFTSCRGYIEDQIIISPGKTEDSSHLGYGVWLEIPKGYKRVDAYDGFQTANMYSSISIKMDEKTIDQIREAYNPEKLSKMNLELIELSSVYYSGNENGLLTVVLDKRKKIIRYLMSIQFNDKTYKIKGFCFERVKEKYDQAIRKSFESIYIGEFVEKQELFKMAKLLSLDEVIYTKDGIYPTETPDKAVIEVKNFTSLKGVLASGLIQSELQKLTGESNTSYTSEGLSNGKFYYSKAETDTKKVYVALMVNEKNEGVLLKCYGNQKSDIDEFEKYVRGKLIKIKVQGY